MVRGLHRTVSVSPPPPVALVFYSMRDIWFFWHSAHWSTASGWATPSQPISSSEQNDAINSRKTEQQVFQFWWKRDIKTNPSQTDSIHLQSVLKLISLKKIFSSPLWGQSQEKSLSLLWAPGWESSNFRLLSRYELVVFPISAFDPLHLKAVLSFNEILRASQIEFEMRKLEEEKKKKRNKTKPSILLTQSLFLKALPVEE